MQMVSNSGNEDDADSEDAPSLPFDARSTKTALILFSICWWIGFPLTGRLSGLPFQFGAVVFGSIILYRNWLLLHGHAARTTPKKATGLIFVPLFWFYWWFVAFAGLATDCNRYMEENRIAGPRLSRRLAIAVCLLAILWSGVLCWPLFHDVVPRFYFDADVPGSYAYLVLYVVAAIANMIAGFVFVLQQTRVILAILAHREKEAGAGQTEDIS
jgi:hypothetical protein